ncbi:MAG: GTPase domain-containing protein [Legionellales bacterium]|nr:GTPase domain-containing protein [Legionellales bacterium]
MQEQHEILLLGPALAGKSQLINRLQGKPFDPRIRSTPAVKSVPQKLSDKRKIIYRDVPPDTDLTAFKKYFNTADQIYLVFNANDPQGLEDLKKYITDFEFHAEAKFSLIATHVDLCENGIDRNLDNEAKVYAHDLGADYFAISLKDEAPATLQTLLSKSTRLPNRSSQLQKQQSVHGGSCFDGQSYYDDSTSVVGLSSYALEQHAARTSQQHQQYDNPSTLLDKKSTRTLSAHDPRDSQTKRSVSHSSKILNPQNPTRQSLSPDRRAYLDERKPKSLNPKQIQTQSATLTPPPPPPAPASGYSFALRMAGIAMILTAVIGLIYIALVVVNIVSAAALIALMNHIVVGIGGLLGASTSTSLMTIAASLNLSTTAAAGMLMAGPSLAVLAIGFGVFRAGQKAAVNTQAAETPSLVV